jgi:transposase InsO family protein
MMRAVLTTVGDFRSREIFETLLEAKVLIERWRHEYNTIRPHSSLGYRHPAPEAIQPWSEASAALQLHATAKEQMQEVLS